MKGIDCFDVTIIGGGPAGLYSAFYSGLRQMKTKLIEFHPQLGGKIQVYPEKMVWDIGGMPPTPGAQVMDQLIAQGMTFNPEVVLNEKIISLRKNEEGFFILKAASGREHLSKTVIVAVGSGILKPVKLNIEGADRFEISNLHYTVKSLKKFKNKTVIISGGGNSAVDWANELEPIAKKVYVIHRKGELSGHESQVSALLNSSAECFFHSTISRLEAGEQEDRIHKVEMKNHLTGDVAVIDVDEVVINHGFDQDTSLLQGSDLSIEMVESFYISGNAASETSVPGLFAAGDILRHDGKVNLIAGAFQDAANAVNKAKQYIDPNADAFAMVSSHNDVFKEKNGELKKKLVDGAGAGPAECQFGNPSNCMLAPVKIGK
ncbi:thioredoxin reductase (NADPH) [Falsibacillus pallidus]|uniref:Ferredoxin--NADP reductase n=1 Tax=Falsibacillus pallidus TaxID=493781 RepID=A0A370G581_9BACI|nr:thioredoxin reductase (NADPH) [Falsibacillus pallidus]